MRASVFVGVLVLASAAAVGLTTYLSFGASLIERERGALVDDATQLGGVVVTRIEQLRRDAEFLAATATVSAFMRARLGRRDDPVSGLSESSARASIEANFSAMLRTRGDYLRVRYIGAEDEGRELIVAERRRGDLRVVPAPELVRDGASTFLRPVFERPSGVYVSPVELSRRDGRIEEPHAPVVHAAVAIRRPDGQVFGVVVIELDFQQLLEKVQAQVPLQRHLFVINRRGDFLLHPDRTRAFRFELGEPDRAADEFHEIPDEFWQAKLDTFTVRHRDGEGDEMILAGYREPLDPAQPERGIGVLLDVPVAVVLGASESGRDRSLVLGTLFIALSLIGVFLATRRVLRGVGGEPEEILAITERIAGGDVDIDFDARQSVAGGILGSVREMVAALRRARTTVSERTWLNTELARVLTVAQAQPTQVELARSVVSELARTCEAGAGAFFMRTLESEPDGTLALLGTFAHGERRTMPDRARPGEGLVGQCMLERQAILLSSVPSSYMAIQSGLGWSTPLQVLVLPVLFDDNVVGVLELASFHAFTGTRRELLDQVSSNLGVIVNGLLSRERTAQLLEEAQSLSEEAQTQAEELRTTNEELEAKSHELEQQQALLEAQSEELRISNEELGRRNSESEAANRELERAQDELEKRARELESASAYKSEFVANMSHELRTPLNSLLLLSRSLSENRSGNLTEDQAEAARVIHQGGQDLLKLINDILDLSKVEAGKLEIQLEEVDVQRLARDVGQEFGPVARHSGVALVVEADEVVPALHTDPQRLRQILRNLVANAFKFTSRGSVTVRVRRGPVDLADGVSFQVSDTGVGIPVDKQEGIFEAFQQADGSITRRYGGTGLGLTISRKLATLLGGRIAVASAQGQGSTFTLVLPRRGPGMGAVTTTPAGVERATPPIVAPVASAPTPAQSVAPVEPPVTDRSLLIVDDDVELAGVLAKLARARGYRTLIASSGRQALTLAAEHLPTAILLDLGLPDLDGARVLEYLKSDLRTRHIPVHIVSGRSEGAALSGRGALGFLHKPISPEALDEAFLRIDSTAAERIKTVLVVDRDATARGAVCTALGNQHLRVVQAASGAEARERLEAEPCDCIVLDLELGDLDGGDLLRELGEALGDELPPVVVYTARELTREQDHTLRAHARTVIMKGERSLERILDEVSLFLHSLGSSLSVSQQRVIHGLHDPDRSLDGRTVLLVDDDMRNVYALSRLLREHRMQVVVAEDGARAIEELDGGVTIDIVLMDMMMPVLDGCEAMRRIRADQRFKSLPMIALTAKAMVEDRERCLSAGANDYLTKPVDTDRLLSVLRVWLFER